MIRWSVACSLTGSSPGERAADEWGERRGAGHAT